MPGEETYNAATRRLIEEMGFTTSLEKIFDFTYKVSFENGLTEHEFDHVFIGEYEGDILPNYNEISDYCYMKTDEIKSSIQDHPEKFTPWFRIAFDKVIEHKTALKNKSTELTLQ